MMFFTPGISFTPRCTECDVIFCVMLTVTRGTPGSLRDVLGDQLAQDLVLRLRGIAELDVDDDVAGADLDLLDRLAADEVLPGVGIDQRAQAGLDVGLGDGHRMLRREMGRDVEKTSILAKNGRFRYSRPGAVC